MERSEKAATGNLPQATENAEGAREVHERHELGGKLCLILVLALIGYAIWMYQLRPYFAAQVPEHAPLLLDLPPLELGSLEVREGGELLVPTLVASGGDTLYLGFAGAGQLHLYDNNLQPLGKLDLPQLPELQPTALAVSDSFLIVGDSVLGCFAVCDRDGYQRATIYWYPDSVSVRPQHLSAISGRLSLCDVADGRLVLISLLDQPPVNAFLELVHSLPTAKLAGSPATCSMPMPDSSIWIGFRNGVAVLNPNGAVRNRLQGSSYTSLREPVDLALQNANSPPALRRVHILDRAAGKVFVFTTDGELTLIYPRDRVLESPTAIALNPGQRHIYIAESGRNAVTVFGY
jgi:hypothetical protein